MFKQSRFLLAGAAAGVLLAGTSPAGATDVNPPMPNVLLLVDSSGSMEYKSGSEDYPFCDPDGAGGPSEKSRWIELVEVLTGSIGDYHCYAADRRSAEFKAEYRLGGYDVYDITADRPYHRPLSGQCAPGPGTPPSTLNAYEYPAGAINYHAYNDVNTSCTFNQAQDGLLDSFMYQVRFGLMTFDTHVDPRTGVTVSNTPDPEGGINGTWSYFVGGSAQGHPTGCAYSLDMEVGARNAAAPPWEGRMVAFGDPTAPPEMRNSWIQEILLATRPYGATPINGMMDDARAFLWNDTSLDPLDPAGQRDFGPYRDPYNSDGCRANTIILLSDGEPNLDLRPHCEAAGTPAGQCPYAQTPEEIAYDMANTPDFSKRTQTFVIGFSLSTVEIAPGNTILCKDLSEFDLNDAGGLCDLHPDNRQLQACCTLNRIAFNGGTGEAFFPTNMDELRAAVSHVLSNIVGAATSRTLPVFMNNVRPQSGGGGTGAAAYRFYSSFVPSMFQLWEGVLERQRFECENQNGVMVALDQPIDVLEGDDFIRNVNSDPLNRWIYSVEGSLQNAVVYSQRSIRPPASFGDGVGNYTGLQYKGRPDTFVTNTLPAAMGIDDNTCQNMNAVECRNKYLRWTVGLNNGSIFNRCPVPGAAECSVVGDIFHSTPVVVGPPAARLRDESYTRFQAEHHDRPLMLLTSTNDGFLHAFDVEVERQENNELWAFVPPAVLPLMPSQYPGAHQLLLDGPAVARDVIAVPDSNTFKLERSPDDARGTNSTWRTVLVQSFGGTRGGYFAIDVTEPDPATAGPRFLWQLTENAFGEPLFGLRGGNPVITTLFVDTSQLSGSGGGPREVAVAILPGGIGPVPNGSKQRVNPTPSDMDSRFPARQFINAYPDTQGLGAKSLTIVRLDNGEIIRSFRAPLPAGPPVPPPPPIDASRITVTPLDSPITGTPAVYPGGTGMIADRIYVGDSDGVLWRIDVSSANPADWTMKMFLDVYTGQDFDDGQAIMTPPILSVDDQGRVTVNYSTGDQEVFSAPPDLKNYVASITEVVGTSDVLQSEVNWVYEFVGGERVAGPMTLFNRSLFFSTFQPEPGTSQSVCATGDSRVWGMDYIKPESTINPPDISLGGRAALPTSALPGAPLVQFIDNNSAFIADDATIFGIGVTQVPTCAVETQVPDEWVGGGTMHTQISGVSPGQFQLVFQTGSSGAATAGGRANVQTMDLPIPYSPPRIESWAAIVE